MNVFIDARMINNSGIGVYTSNLISIAINNKAVEHVYISYKKNNLKYFLENAKVIKLLYDASIYSFAEQFKAVSVQNKISGKVDFCHYPHYNKSLFLTLPYIVTVHDVIMFQFNYGNIFKRKVALYLLKNVVLNAKNVICISQSTKNNLKTLIPELNESKISVIYNSTGVNNFGQIKILDTELNKINADNYLMCVGLRKPHKNFEIILKALKIILVKVPDMKLVMVGKKDKKIDYLDNWISDLNINNSVIQIENTTPQLLVELYRKSLMVIHPSFVEGFGFIPFESISMGKLPLLSDVEINRELFGNDGIYFDPENENDLSDKILYYSVNQTEMDSAIQKLKRYLDIYSFKKFENEINELYVEVSKSLK